MPSVPMFFAKLDECSTSHRYQWSTCLLRSSEVDYFAILSKDTNWYDPVVMMTAVHTVLPVGANLNMVLRISIEFFSPHFRTVEVGGMGRSQKKNRRHTPRECDLIHQPIKGTSS